MLLILISGRKENAYVTAMRNDYEFSTKQPDSLLELNDRRFEEYMRMRGIIASGLRLLYCGA
jgi:hypothetical protein